MQTWIAKVTAGERFRKATPKELRWYSAMFAFLPIYLIAFAYVGFSFLNRATAIGVGLYMLGSLVVGAFCLSMWVRFVPTAASWVISSVVWIVFLWLALAGALLN